RVRCARFTQFHTPRPHCAPPSQLPMLQMLPDVTQKRVFSPSHPADPPMQHLQHFATPSQPQFRSPTPPPTPRNRQLTPTKTNPPPKPKNPTTAPKTPFPPPSPPLFSTNQTHRLFFAHTSIRP